MRSLWRCRAGAAVAVALVAAPLGAGSPVDAGSPAGDQFILTTTTSVAASPTPSVEGETVTFTATVSSLSGDPIPGGRVRFDVDGIEFFANVDVATDGTAVFSTSALAPGPHEVFAMYSGYQPSENDGLPDAMPSTVTIGHVVLAATGSTLTSSANPATVGEPVTFTARVTSGALSADGVVTFLDGSTPIGTVALDVNGEAELTTTDLTAGTHTITARYDGTATLGPSTAALDQVIDEPPPATTASTTTTTSTTTQPATTSTLPGRVTSTTTTTDVPDRPATVTDLASSANPSMFGQSVTFTVTVTSASVPEPAAFGRRAARAPRQVAGGTLTISDGDAVLAVLSLEDGRASFTTSALAVGAHSITASFSGTATAAPSTATIAQQVDPPPPTLPPTR